MPEQPLGHITHFFGHIGVAVVSLTDGALKIGDTIHVTGHSDFQQVITSMQVDHLPVEAAKKGSEVAMKLDQPVKPHDQLFKVTE